MLARDATAWWEWGRLETYHLDDARWERFRAAEYLVVTVDGSSVLLQALYSRRPAAPGVLRERDVDTLVSVGDIFPGPEDVASCIDGIAGSLPVVFAVRFVRAGGCSEVPLAAAAVSRELEPCVLGIRSDRQLQP